MFLIHTYIYIILQNILYTIVYTKINMIYVSVSTYKHISGIQSICDRRNTVWDFTKVFNRGRRRIRTFWLGKISRSLNIHNPWSSVQLAKNFVHRVGISPREINVYPMYIPIISNTYIHQLRWCLVPWEGARRGGQYTLLIDLMPNCSFGDGVGFTGWKCQNLVHIWTVQPQSVAGFTCLIPIRDLGITQRVLRYSQPWITGYPFSGFT